MKKYTLNEVQDKLIGKIGTPERDLFEYELQTEIVNFKSMFVVVYSLLLALRSI